jgi:hypothetical protein
MARYQKERKDWVNVFKCCEEGIPLLQETGKLEGMGQQLLALLPLRLSLVGLLRSS